MTSFPKLLGPESPQMGTQFLSSVSICFSDDSIHQAIHDKKRPKKSEIQASFGFAVPTGKPYSVYGRGRKESVTAATISADAIRFNAPQMLSTDKLRLLNSSRVGAVLGVFFTPNSPPVIGFGASPVSTTFNGQDAVHRGAPKWSDCFDPTLIQQYWQGDMSVPTHSLVVSLSGRTRLKMPASQQDFVQATKPAMLVGDFSKILLIPDGCGAPVGLYWPTSISFEDFKNSLSGHGTPYGSFLDLLRSQSSIFEEWFTAVNSSAGSYQLQTTSAMDLWATLPCPSNLHGNGLLNVAAAQPLREQFARYVMGMALDCALFGPCDVDDRQAIRQRCQVGAWLERARQCYPPALGYHGPPDHFAYLSVLCPPEDGWPWPEFSTWLSDLPFDALPDRYQRFEPKAIPVKARAVFVPAILVEKEDPDSDLDAYANVFATTAPTVTATPNIATVPAPAPNVATPSPPKEAPLPPVRQSASPPSVPQDVLDAMQKVRAFQEQIVHGTSAGTPANPVDLVAGDVEEYDIRPNDLATRFASSANDSSPAAVMRAGSIADRRRSSLAQGRFGAGPRTGSLGLAPMRNDMFNPQTLAAALGVRQSRFVSADKASLASVQARRTCSPYFLNVALVLASFFPQEEQPYLCLSDDRVVAATDWMKVPEPTQLARDLIAVWDHGHKEATSGVTRTLHYALRFRADIATDFQQIPLPYEAEFDLLNFAMHKSICDVARWKMGRKVPPPPVGGPSWHIFHLLPLVNSTYGGTCIPPGGLPIADAQLFGKYVYLLMSLFGSQEDATMDQIYGGDYDDSVFRASLFGQNLLHLCKLPQHTAVIRLWRCRPRQCTLQWMEDLCALFGEVTAMVRYRSGAAPTTLGLQDATFHGEEDIVAGAFVVAPTMVGRHEFTKKPLCYLDKFQLLYERVERKWDPAELDVNGHTWSHSFSSSFFGTAIPPVLPPRGPDPFRQGVSDGVQPPLAKRQRLELPPAGPPPGPPRPEHTVPFTAKKPLFKSLLPVEAGQSVYEAVLMKKLVRGDSPLLLNPQATLARRSERRGGRLKSPPHKRQSRAKCSGLRYRAMVPAGRLSHLPSPLRAAFNDCVRDFITIDRGTVRSNNDQSFESRAAHFARFCEDMECSEHYLRGLDWADTLRLLGTYLHSVQRGNNLDNLTDLSAQTMTNYLSAAHRWLEVVQDHSIDIYDPHSSGKGRRYHPFLAQQLADCRSWKKPRSKREPFSMLMFEKLLAEFSASITPTRRVKILMLVWLQLCLWLWMCQRRKRRRCVEYQE